MIPSRPRPYNAIVNVDDPAGVHRRVSVAAAGPAEALALLRHQFGEHAIVEFWGPVLASGRAKRKPRSGAVVPQAD